MFDAIKNLFSSSKESAPESQWDSRTVQLQQPNSPANMNEAVSQQPQGPEGMKTVHMRGGGEGEDVCCGVCAGLCCFECCECCC